MLPDLVPTCFSPVAFLVCLEDFLGVVMLMMMLI
jgi:hypothetical protein